MDERQFRTTPLMTATLERSVVIEAFDIRFLVLDLPALAALRRSQARTGE